ncbi:MAG: hypothetical protein KKF48_05840 [Nanoarchaeota archaeon]|nr:hypothetical protein [Nanoarchaeota archaeon]
METPQIPDIGAIINEVAAGSAAAKTKLLDLINTLLDIAEEAEARELQAADDIRVVYRNRLGMFHSPPLWASQVEENWQLLRDMVYKDTGADIGEWPDKKQIKRIHQTQADPALYQKESRDINYFS